MTRSKCCDPCCAPCQLLSRYLCVQRLVRLLMVSSAVLACSPRVFRRPACMLMETKLLPLNRLDVPCADICSRVPSGADRQFSPFF